MARLVNLIASIISQLTAIVVVIITTIELCEAFWVKVVDLTGPWALLCGFVTFYLSPIFGIVASAKGVIDWLWIAKFLVAGLLSALSKRLLLRALID